MLRRGRRLTRSLQPAWYDYSAQGNLIRVKRRLEIRRFDLNYAVAAHRVADAVGVECDRRGRARHELRTPSPR